MRQKRQKGEKFFLLRPAADPRWSAGRRAVYYVWRAALVFCAGLCMGLALLLLAVGPYSAYVLTGYVTDGTLLLLNTLPVGLLTLLLYGALGRPRAAFLLGGGVFLGLSLGNYYKLYFRDDPLYFEDLTILREAGNMAGGGHYSLFVDKKIALAVLCLILGAVLLGLLAPGKLPGWKKRLAAVLGSLAVMACLAPVYLDASRYDRVENYELLNRWSPTQNYIAHGFVYPFLHSVSDFVETAPAGYSSEKAEAILAQYDGADIPEDRKISVIAVMREAYADFSRYGIEGFDASCYDGYHALEAESLSGDLMTNIFAGGTVDSERCFLTGDYRLKNFRGDANSYLWYLRDQGYTVEGSHPYYGWFYNRKNVNAYLGFERYRFYEGDYELLTDAMYPEDAILYPEVYRDLISSRDDGKPCFSFVLNVQSHGPYETGSYGGDREYLTGNYSQACKNAFNNYMDIIMQGDEALLDLVEQLRADGEPVVLVTFGDHLPWMGDGNVFYDEMGVDLDPGTEAGFRTHYQTRYLLWANPAAREILGDVFTGEGPTISPCYLMDLLFEKCGWDGPAYMQAMEDFRAVFPVVTTNGCYVVDGAFTDAIPEDREELFLQFQWLQYYWRNEFLY